MTVTPDTPNLLIELIAHSEPASLVWQLGAIAVIMLLAWWFDALFLKNLLAAKTVQTVAIRGVKRIVFPLLNLFGVLIAREVFRYLDAPFVLLKLAIPLFLSLACIRLLVYVLHKVFSNSSKLRSWERTIAMIAWLGVALHVTGLLDAVLAGMENLSFNAGHQHISLLIILQGLISIAATVLLALWLGRFLETRIMGMQEMESSSRVLLTKVVRGALLVLSVLVALSLVGIDIRVLSVFGGALGVGLGFGLQRIASNYICGFIILLDKSIRLGDVITLDNRTGTVARLTGRYMVLSGQDGTEFLIPNEMAITQALGNHSYSDRKIRIKISLQVAYNTPLEQAMGIMAEAARQQEHVMSEPAPSVNLINFADNGILLELLVWLDDPEVSQATLRSKINMEIWREFQKSGIEIPFPQREVRIKP
ncbi:MAG TPA: mechanosensitive ion channel protein MscS [Gallionella sp.]|nr:mechanosensitive ion channel [Gallionella sp.]OGS66226.1 MAG: mechanosensitive ion channel protein MscS [Gallionellales bacterium GWA2_54_124]OGT20073.1 MAG: mechanosensitive ion channel protein MscS [Gallionellales bacterium RIFOXYD12_FULL_53_10]HCI52834.1 mechanosensitive ion channel protein MscS [Gallionella sp.]